MWSFCIIASYLEELYVVAPQGEALNIEAHLVKSEVIRLGHLLLICGQGGFRLLLTEHYSGVLLVMTH